MHQVRLSVVPCVYLALIIYIEKKDAVSFMENLLENVAPDLLEMIDEISDNHLLMLYLLCVGVVCCKYILIMLSSRKKILLGTFFEAFKFVLGFKSPTDFFSIFPKETLLLFFFHGQSNSRLVLRQTKFAGSKFETFKRSRSPSRWVRSILEVKFEVSSILFEVFYIYRFGSTLPSTYSRVPVESLLYIITSL